MWSKPSENELYLLKSELTKENNYLINNEDYIGIDTIEVLIKYGRISDVRKIIGKSIAEDGGYKNWCGDAYCEICGELTFFSLSKTKLIDYISFQKNGGRTKEEIYTYFSADPVVICNQCYVDYKNHLNNLEKIRKEEQRKNKPEPIDFIEVYLSPDRVWNDGIIPYNKYNLIKYQQNIDKTNVIKHIKSMDYYDFLKTPYWKAIAGWVRHKAKYKCQLCGGDGKLAVHHRNYKNHGDEVNHLEDLICLCDKCHSKYHDKD